MFPGEQSAFPQGLFLEFSLQKIPQQKTRIRSVPDAKASYRLLIQSPSLEVLARMRAFRAPEALLKELTGYLVNIEQGRPVLGLPRFFGTGIRELRQRQFDLAAFETKQQSRE